MRAVFAQRRAAAAGVTPPFRRVLVANRGEIAVRIIRACRELGMESVAVYSDADAGARHVRAADMAVRIGPAPAAESYLRIDRSSRRPWRPAPTRSIRAMGSSSEQAAFAEACRGGRASTFVGPSPDASPRWATSSPPRRRATAAGVPVVPGTLRAGTRRPARPGRARSRAAAERGRLPAAGQGRGRRRRTRHAPRRRPRELPAALAAGRARQRRRSATAPSTWSATSSAARHVEVQLLGDAAGHGRRPRRARLLDPAAPPEAGRGGARARPQPDQRARPPRAGRQGRVDGRACATRRPPSSCSTPSGAFWFLEVNARLQVEHGVTELVTGLDLVHEQFCLAAGQPLSDGVRAAAAGRGPAAPRDRGPPVGRGPGARRSRPAPGRVARWRSPPAPASASTRASRRGAASRGDYDPLIAKLMVDRGGSAGGDRADCAAPSTRSRSAGIQTTLPFHRCARPRPALRGRRAVHRLGRGALGRPSRQRRARSRSPRSPPERPTPTDRTAGARWRRRRPRQPRDRGLDAVARATARAGKPIDRWPS